ncbi:MAG: hypothetical protein DWQ44_07815 [Bacteroidetes bacterium]|nr:MAG: hypothetical protein DWQ33_06985 [Bacteroidota bacterium]REJ99670.1 MAG: hypothetical protein DWQ39_12115 [Bacteroidota bacterium]REK33903.1 MAG: hypothetical protein DWQ44_07815 [Bacteroidota bacterium]REK47668.1 MAG: hypothetical protein DWQ48_11850 [Bacteroidota bacterium]
MNWLQRYSILFAIFLLCLLVLNFVYNLLDAPFSGTDINLINRGIDTTEREWLNGYLGLFFRFKFLGNINWLLLPLIILYMSVMKFKKWELAALISWLFIFFLVMSKGYFNMRYQITLLPLTLTMLLYISWKLFDFYKFGNERFLYFFFLVILLIYNDVKFFTSGTSKTDEALAHVSGEIKSGTTEHTKNYTLWMNPKPVQMIQYLKNIDPQLPNSGVIVNNLPSYYYYTGKKGVYYWCQDDVYYSKDGEQKLMRGREDFNALAAFIRDSLQCGFILSTFQFEGYNPLFDKFIQDKCRLEFQDPTGYVLYSVL